jgi:hypothetical protein
MKPEGGEADMRSLGGMILLVDRTMALFVGLAAGAAIAFSFQTAPVEVTAVSVPAVPEPAAPARAAAASRNAPAARAIQAVAAPGATAQAAPRLASAATEGRPIRIGVFGDSFGEGVWAGLYNRLRADPGFEVRQFSERSTGFTRYRSLNILDDIRAKLDRQPVDIAILSFGANDTQGIWDGRHGHAYMSEGWQRIVTERVTAVVALLRERGAAVYWVGLPRMRDPGFDADIQAMNRFYGARMAALGIPYVDTLALTVDDDGEYAPYLPPEPGRAERRMARANDGVHMTIPGYVHLTGGLTDNIRASVDQARAQAVAAAPATADGETAEDGSQG